MTTKAQLISSVDPFTVDSGGGGSAVLPFINVKDAPYNAKGDGVTNDTAAFVAANAAIAATGGTLYVPGGVYLITSFTPSGGVFVRGVGTLATTLKGSGAGQATVDIRGSVSFGGFYDMTIDGGAVKNCALSLGSTIGAGSCGNWRFDHVRMLGGVQQELIIGNPTDNPDISSITFIDCLVRGGADGSVVPADCQIRIAGSNTLLIQWIGGEVFGAPIPILLKMIGGDCTCYDVQWANSTSYAIEAASGQFRDYGSHSEGTGGYFHSLSTDSQNVHSGQHTFKSLQITNTGANSAGRAIYHQAGRRISINDCFFNENVEINGGGVSGVGSASVNGNTFGIGSGYILSQGGQIFGSDADGGITASAGTFLRITSGQPAAFIGTTNTSPTSQDCYGYGEPTILAAADVNGPNRLAMFFIVFDTSTGDNVVVHYAQNQTPVIIHQFGVAFTTAAPGADEIQIKTRGVGLGVAFRAGANRDTHKLTWAILACS